MKNIDFETMNEWINQQGGLIQKEAFFEEEDAFEEEGAQFYQGNLSVDTLSVSPCVVIDGNLEVADEITWDFDVGLLVVKGDLRCKTFDFALNAVISGNLYASEINIGSDCDYQLSVGGDVYATSIIENGHSIEIHGQAFCSEIVSKLNHLSIGGKVISRNTSA
ncbi:hypothetical protein [Chitinibacter sp. GC72]|uniref:hypothetical protein n=1 Tax=Chitinibacter sp. GC72 TaxID=1526917 RepID=UPI0012F7179B|nr:hypothetical protein [Chitinibacter sp. GC72]